MTSLDIHLKLEQVLLQFLTVDFKICDDTCFEKLLTHLLSQADDDTLRLICVNWLVGYSRQETHDPAILSFAGRLTAQIATLPHGYLELKSSSVIEQISAHLKNGSRADPSLALAYILLMSSLLKHNAGCELLIESAWWLPVVQLRTDARSIYVTREAERFISQLLSTCCESNPTLCRNVLAAVLEPLARIPCDDTLLLSTISLANFIMQESLTKNQLAVAQTMRTQFELEPQMTPLLQSKNSTVTEKAAQQLILMLLTAFKSEVEVPGRGDVTEADLLMLEKKVFAIFWVLVGRKDFRNIVKVTNYCHHMWKKTIPNSESCDANKHLFENQLIVVQIVPFLAHISTRMTENEYLDFFVDKLFLLSTMDTQRIGYALRDAIYDLDEQQEIAREAVLSLLQLSTVMHKDRAVIVFQSLVYKLKDFVPCDQPSQGNVERFPRLLAAILSAIVALMDRHHISWRESVETLVVFSLSQGLLKDPAMTPTLSVLALKVMQVAVAQFMPPNLALLVDTVEGSTINQLGPMAMRQLRDVSWNVRDSALELMRHVAEIAHDKFPAFQEHVIKHELCEEVLRLSDKDGESYVRASALRCLGSMVRVEAFWKQCLCQHNLPDRVVAILQTEDEGIVRREAAALMGQIYQHVQIPPSSLAAVYSAMSAATADLYWEVSVNALDFWRQVIDRQLSDQGMIDGVFPEVTFSKEHRKIVQLTPDAIATRIGKVLKSLEMLGCLQVLLTALDDCDVEVVEKSSEILVSLSKTISKYNVVPHNASSNTETVPLLSPPIISITDSGSEDVDPFNWTSIMDIPRADKRKIDEEMSEELDCVALLADRGTKPCVESFSVDRPEQEHKHAKMVKTDDNRGSEKHGFYWKGQEMGCIPLTFGESGGSGDASNFTGYQDENGEDERRHKSYDGQIGKGASAASNQSVLTPRYVDELFLDGFGVDSNQSGQDIDDVIEDIVQATDMNLLASVYNTQMTISDDKEVAAKTSVSSEEFLERLSQLNLEGMLAEKRRWLVACGDDMGSLLDDMLAVNKSKAPDCY